MTVPAPGLDTDVLVVGGGASGLTAAIFARKAGARVILLEKANQLGGSTRVSVGTYTASGTPQQRRSGIVDNAQAHYEDMPKFGNADLAARDNVALRRILVDHAAETLQWLTSIGMRFHGPMPEPPHRVPRMHLILPNADAFLYFLEREARRLGVEIRLEAGVDDLIVEQGGVRGARITQAGVKREVRCTRSVVLATGDFSASAKWKAQFRPEVAQIDGVAATSTGEGHDMAQALGARLQFGDVVYGPNLRFMPPPRTNPLLKIPPHPLFTSAIAWALDVLPQRLLRPFILGFATSYLSPEPSLFRAGAILVNRNGERFADETGEPNYAFSAQPDQVGYIVFDQRIATSFSRWPNFISTAPGVGYAYFQDYQRTRPDIYHTGGTPEALAASMGIASDALARTIRNAGESLAQRPLHALGPVKSWIILTEGSISVNERHQVTRASGDAIPGLYAVGAVGQGGLLLLGHGHHLAWAFTSGRLGGMEAARADTVG